MNIEAIKDQIHKFISRNLGTILIYHSIVDIPLEFDMWTHMHVSLFEEHMQLLARETNVVPLEEMVNGIKKGRLPQNAVAVTFDDGFGNNYTRAYPILKKYNIPATIFLSTAYIGTKELFWPERLSYIMSRTKADIITNNDIGEYQISDGVQKRNYYNKISELFKQYNNNKIDSMLDSLQEQLRVEFDQEDLLYQEWLPLSWDEARQMEKESLISFGGHTNTHAILSTNSDEEIRAEIQLCKLAIENNLLNGTRYWAHPNGHLGDFYEKHELMLEQSGYEAIFTSIPQYINEKTPLERTARIGIGSNVSSDQLRTIICKRSCLDQFHGLAKFGYMTRAVMVK